MKVVIIAGPTATGKTEVALNLAKHFNGELVNADSRQVYKYLDIATNKGNLEFKDGIYYLNSTPIYLVNILKPNERFNLFLFQEKALDSIKDISSRGKIPIIIGGTGLYLDSLIKGYSLGESNTEDREALQKLSVVELQQKISSSTLNILNNSDKNNPRRLIRVIEKSEEIQQNTRSLDLETFLLYPKYNWEELKIKIDNRVEEMFNNGLVDETKNILSMGFTSNDDGLKIMGYKQVLEFIDNKIDLNTCIERVKISHKQYAKRQRTWFEGVGRDYKLNIFNSSDEAIKLADKFIND